MRIQPIIARSLLGLLGATLFASPVAAQVFDSGPSDPALFDNVINLPNISFEESLGGDGLTTQLNVSGNRSVGRFFSANSGTEVNVSGGEVQSFFSANSGSEVNVSGGRVGLGFDANSGSLVNISGGTVGAGTGGFDANSGSVVNISGGNAGNNFEAHPGSEVNISGGSVGGSARFLPGSDVELFGGEFNLNGAPFTGSTITLSEGDVFTGTLTDGSAFIFSSELEDVLSEFTLTLTALPPIDTTPIVVNTVLPTRPSGLRTGQTLTLQDGGQLDNFEAVGATLNIEGGQLGGLDTIASLHQGVVNISGGRLAGLLSVIDSEVNVSGGSGRIEAFGGEVNISGGSSVFVSAQPGTVVNLSDGSIGSGFTATAGSEVNISGGSVGAIFNAALDSVVNISGGTFESGEFFNGAFGRFFRAQHFSNVNLFGSEFVLDGVLLDDSLTIDNAFTIVDRDVTLSGVLADGSPFSFLLNSRPSSDGSVTDLFTTTATLTVTLVSSAPELGDVNLDGEITFADIGPFIAALQAGTFLEQADCNQDGVVDFADIASFIEILQAG